MTLDANHHNVTRDDMVKVREGEHKGRQATVKHIHRNAVFLHSNDVRNDQGGMWVEKNRNINLLGGAGAARMQPGGPAGAFLAPRTPMLQSPGRGDIAAPSRPGQQAPPPGAFGGNMQRGQQVTQSCLPTKHACLEKLTLHVPRHQPVPVVPLPFHC